MGVGHAAVALGASRLAPRINVGLLIFAALLADFLLGIFAWAGLEHADVPADYASRHYLLFTFPYSHGLAFLLLWGIILGAMLFWVDKQHRGRVFLVIAALVVSHFVLDALVHVRGLPMAGENSPKFGLGLWNHLPLELSLETLMTAAGLILYWQLASRGARWGIAVFMVLLAALTWTQLWMATPPTMSQLIPNWIIAPIVLSAIPYAIDRKRVLRQNG